MRTLGVAVLLLAVGCDDGVFVEVKATPGVTEVELFIALRPCESEDVDQRNCDHLRPPDFQLGVPGDVFIRDHDEPYRATVEDGSAWFRLGVEPLEVPRLVAVGFKSGAPTAAAVASNVSLDSTHKVVVDLQTAGIWEPASPRDGRHVKLWAQDRCLGIREDSAVSFIVPDGDTDCDEVPTPECDPLAYLDDQQLETACVDHGMPLGSDDSLCMLGTKSCSETDPATSGGCQLSQTILPDTVCTSCFGKGAFCIQNALEQKKPRVHCKLRGQDENQSFQRCGETTEGFDPARIVDAESADPICFMTAALGPLQFPFGTFAQQFGEPPVTIRAFNDTTCGIELDWHVGAAPVVGNAPEPVSMLMQAKFTLGATYEYIVPVDVEWSTDCAEPQICTLEQP